MKNVEKINDIKYIYEILIFITNLKFFYNNNKMKICFIFY